MENKENKLIADKINSLDYLPEGYNPNLEAKWALLQSQEKKEKVIFLFEKNTWLKIAACLIFFLLCSVVWINRTSKHQSEIANIRPQVTPSTTPKLSPSKTANVQLQKDLVVIEKNNNTPIHKHKTKSDNNVRSNSPSDESISNSESPLAVEQSVSETIQPTQLSEVTNTQDQATNVKSKKSRYVQLDFENEILKPEAKTTFAQGIQFKFSLKNSNSEENNLKENSSLKLKHNF